MAFCTNCGTAVPENAPSCPACGAVLFQHMNQPVPPQAAPAPEQANPYAQQANTYAPPQENPYAQQAYQQPYYGAQQQNPYAPPMYAPERNSHANAVSTARTLGIVAIIFMFFNSLVSIILGAIGLSKANAAIAYAQQVNDMALLTEANSAKRLNNIPLVISLVLAALGALALILSAALGVTGEMKGL